MERKPLLENYSYVILSTLKLTWKYPLYFLHHFRHEKELTNLAPYKGSSQIATILGKGLNKGGEDSLLSHPRTRI